MEEALNVLAPQLLMLGVSILAYGGMQTASATTLTKLPFYLATSLKPQQIDSRDMLYTSVLGVLYYLTKKLLEDWALVIFHQHGY